MGRNAASSIFWTHTVVPTGDLHIITWYCQQHAKWDQLSNATLATAFATLKTHIETQHGNVEQ